MKGRTVLVGMVMACVMAVGVAPVAAQQDVCIHVDGVEVYQSGNASCDSTEGNTVDLTDTDDSHATVIGDDNDVDVDDSVNSEVDIFGDRNEVDIDGVDYCVIFILGDDEVELCV